MDELAKNQYVNNGEVAIIDSTTVEITELPIKTWTQVCEVCFYTFFRKFIHDLLSDSGFLIYIFFHGHLVCGK